VRGIFSLFFRAGRMSQPSYKVYDGKENRSEEDHVLISTTEKVFAIVLPFIYAVSGHQLFLIL
jgi:hypothetical protein